MEETLRLSSCAEDIHKRELSDSARLCIVAEEDASATVFLMVKEGTVTIEADVMRGASLTIVCVQSSEKTSTISERATVAEGGRVRWQNVTLGADVTQDVRTELTGAHARSDVDWIFHIAGTHTQKLRAHNVFDAPDGEGEITMKGVAEGTAHAVAHGMIEISERGRGTDTYLTEDVLMLDPTAKIDAIPGLEIRTNDVKASHSATVSRVTPEDLFYFQSRGIDESEARKMYVQGFLGELTERIENTDLRQTIHDVITAASTPCP